MFRALSLLKGSPVCEMGVARVFSSSVVNLGQPQGTMTMFQSLLKAATGHPGLISPSLRFEQKRYYWGHEGRIGYRRRREKEMRERVKILNPSSPVIDYRVPWPKDDTESLPSDLFGQQMRELSREEVSLKQNLILQQINGQIESKDTGRLFAVVHLSGKQFKVTPEDIIIVQGTFAPNIGDQIRLHKVLLVGSKDFTLVGRPLIDQDLTRVEATVIEKTLSYTKMNFIMKAKKNFRRLRFHKTPYTMLRINLIDIIEPLGAPSTETDTWEREPLKTLS